MPGVFDQDGNFISDVNAIPPHLGSWQDTRSVGAALWELFHPGQVKKEYDAVGKPAPSTGEIIGGAVDDIVTAGTETEHNAGEAAVIAAKAGYSVMQLLVIGIVAYAAIKALDRAPSQKRIKQYARKQLRRAHAAVKRRIK